MERGVTCVGWGGAGPCCRKSTVMPFGMRSLRNPPEGKSPLVRPRHGRKEYISMDLQEVGWGGMNWIGLAQDRDTWRAVVREAVDIPVP